MEKKPEQKNVSSLIGMNLVNGTPKINDQNCGIFSMVKNNMESILEYFQLVIGQN